MGAGSLPAALYVNKIKKLSNLQVHCNAYMGAAGRPGQGRFRRWWTELVKWLARTGHILEIAKNVLVFTIGVW